MCSEMAVTSAPVSSLNSVTWPHSCILANHDVSSVDDTVSRNAVSKWLSLESSATDLEKHCVLKWPFRWQRWHVASFAGHLSQECWPLPQCVHWFWGVGLGFGLRPKLMEIGIYITANIIEGIMRHITTFTCIFNRKGLPEILHQDYTHLASICEYLKIRIDNIFLL